MSEILENMLISYVYIFQYDETWVSTKLLSELSSPQISWLLLAHTIPNQVTCTSNK